MVVGYKNMEDKNGRRSRGHSPNGNIFDDSSASEDSDHDGGMRVGEDYQVLVPPFNPGARSDARAEAMLVWAPHSDLAEGKLDEYIHVAKEKHNYNVEQALGMLFWHKHSVDKALTDLSNFTPFPDEWTVEDKVLFEQAFSFHGKSFHRIRQMLPDKSIASLVKYYYSWKKTRSRTSLMDRQARKLTSQREDSEEDVEDSGHSDTDEESSKDGAQPPPPIKEEIKPAQQTLKPQPTPIKKMEMGGGPLRLKGKRKPPRGMYLNHEDMIALATGPPGQGEAILKQLDTELVTLKRQVQNNKQLLGMHKQKTLGGLNDLRPPENILKINPRWSNDELLLAVQGVRKYGKDFKAIAEVIGNKTEAHIRSFFVNYRRRYNLDEVLGEYEKEHGGQDGSTAGATEECDQMEVESPDTSRSNNSTPSMGGDKTSPTPPPPDNTTFNTEQPLNKSSPPPITTENGSHLSPS